MGAKQKYHARACIKKQAMTIVSWCYLPKCKGQEKWREDWRLGMGPITGDSKCTEIHVQTEHLEMAPKDLLH